MKKIIPIILAAAIIMSAVFTGCGSKSDSNGEVNVYNWGEFIDESIFADFEKETGIKVNYKTYFTNEALYSMLKTGGSSYDVIIPSDYMISRLIDEDMLEKLDFSNIPNFEKLDSKYTGLEFDPNNEYSVAYMGGIVGIIYNRSMISDNITSWSALFDEKYSGNILMFDNSRDAMGIALKYLGYSLNTTNETELNEAYELLVTQRPILQTYVMDQIFDKLESGEAAIGPYYAGDYITMSENNPDLRFVIPSEGTNQFVDSMCIPKGAANKENAEKFINFMCSTDVCVKNMESTGYTSPNKEACEIYAEGLTNEQYNIMFPSEADLVNSEVYVNLPQDILELYDELWVKIKS